MKYVVVIVLVLIFCVLSVSPREITVSSALAEFELNHRDLAQSQSQHVSNLQPNEDIGARTITAYTLGREEENDSDPCIGAYGDNLCELAQKGVQICATRSFDKGTLLRVGDIECIVLDKTSRKYADRVDLAMMEYDEAIKFGIKQLQVSVMGHAILK